MIPMSQDEAKLKIKELVEKYETVKTAGKIAHFSEEDTKTNFIMPLFGALGWNLHDREEVTAEEQISGQRVDYGFYHDGHIKFYLEAKPLKADLHREEFAKQAIRYSWNKGVTWAILTDFESLIVFNALSPEKALHGKKYFEIPYTEYLERFDQLWLLSKEGFSQNLLDQEAEKHGKKLQKVSVTENLSKDLNECRELLTNAFSTCNPGVPSDFIDEGVQKLLDRLIFIRVAEDRRIEEPTLRPLINQWIANGRQGSPYHSMVEKFRELDVIYNSNLFSEHPFEKWDEFAGVTEKVIDILYGKKSYFEYDFAIIPADVLGSVYENYLGYKMQKAAKKMTLFGEAVELGKDARKRKEHGIYYTPKFIVQYIVEHTLGPVLDRCQSIGDLQKIKVLDPACGSGSFLVAALELILKKYESFGRKPNGLTKIQILESNIYGVDLDQQAVELARLNLLLQIFDKQVKLPNLGNNIKNGNSLISGTDKELRKFFGKNFRDKKPFNWEDEFPEVFKQGGFDVVIGNPPWVSNDNINQIDKDFFKEKFTLANSRFDLANLFVEQSVNILSGSGMFAFVMPEHVWIGEYFQSFRMYLEKNLLIKEIISLKEGSFAEVANPSSLFVAEISETKSPDSDIMIGLLKLGKLESYNTHTTIASRVIFDNIAYHLQKKIEAQNLPRLGDIAVVTDGIQTANLLKEIFTQKPGNEDDYIKALRSGASIKYRYALPIWDNWWVLKPDRTRHLKRPGFSYDSPKRMKCFSSKEKIIFRQTEPTILATLDTDKYFFPNSIFQISIEDGDANKLRFLLGILNSKFIRLYYSKQAQVEGTTKPQMYLNIVKSLPIPPEASSDVVMLVNRILSLNKDVVSEIENSEKWLKIKDEIRMTDKKIDQEVYHIYGLTDEEIKIVESN